MSEVLKISRGNSKLSDAIYHVSLLSGHSCPAAKDCFSKAVENEEGRRSLQDGPDMIYRCFSASQEVLYPAVYDQRKYNYDLVGSQRTTAQIVQLLDDSIDPLVRIFRFHIGGDFKWKRYFQAAVQFTKNRPNTLFYAYTKMLSFWIEMRKEIPSNLVLTASRGGKFDHLIEPNGLREAIVVGSESEADRLNLEIDHDDSHAMRADGRNFALLIHGGQAKGTEGAEWVKQLKKDKGLKGNIGYGKKRGAF